MRLLVCGSRGWRNSARIRREIEQRCPSVIIEGGARGADAMARRAAQALGIPVEEYRADWDRYGKQAGYIRNARMLDEGRPDVVLAFWDGESRGTAMMVELARGRGVPVVVCMEREGEG